MKRTLLALAATTVLGVGLAAPAHANDYPLELRGPNGGVHSRVFWDDSVDTLCLTLVSTNASAHAIADMRLVGGGYVAHLDVNPSHRTDCSGNLSIAEDRLAEVRIAGSTSQWSNATGWGRFYT